MNLCNLYTYHIEHRNVSISLENYFFIYVDIYMFKRRDRFIFYLKIRIMITTYRVMLWPSSTLILINIIKVLFILCINNNPLRIFRTNFQGYKNEKGYFSEKEKKSICIGCHTYLTSQFLIVPPFRPGRLSSHLSITMSDPLSKLPSTEIHHNLCILSELFP